MFMLNEEQTLLRDAARDFVQDKIPVSVLRRVRDARAPKGFDQDLWAEMVAMGWTGVLVPEEHGGVGLGYVGMGLVLEEAGRTLAPSPLHSTAVIGAAALMLGGSDAQKADLLPKLVGGELLFALAVDEKAHHAPGKPETALVGGKLTGRKVFVADGQSADVFIVSAKSDGGVALCLVRANAPGVTVKPLATVDSRGGADVSFDGAPIEGVLEGGTALLDRVLDRARICLAAEMLGTAQQAFDITADYLKTRVQFGVLIGSFQALQHRAAKMLVELELTRSCVRAALSTLDDPDATDAKIAELASLAKAMAGETVHLVSNEMVQMHGGIGMTDQHDAGLYMKRARVVEHLYGGASFHRDRFARSRGI